MTQLRYFLSANYFRSNSFGIYFREKLFGIRRKVVNFRYKSSVFSVQNNQLSGYTENVRHKVSGDYFQQFGLSRFFQFTKSSIKFSPWNPWYINGFWGFQEVGVRKCLLYYWPFVFLFTLNPFILNPFVLNLLALITNARIITILIRLLNSV